MSSNFISKTWRDLHSLISCGIEFHTRAPSYMKLFFMLCVYDCQLSPSFDWGFIINLHYPNPMSSLRHSKLPTVVPGLFTTLNNLSMYINFMVWGMVSSVIICPTLQVTHATNLQRSLLTTSLLTKSFGKFRHNELDITVSSIFRYKLNKGSLLINTTLDSHFWTIAW